MPGTGPLAAPAHPALPGCGFFDLSCHVGQAVDSWFAGLVKSAINPLFSLLGRTLLATPQVGGLAEVRSLWAGSVAITDAAYVLAVLAGGILVMSHQSLQTSYTVKGIPPAWSWGSWRRTSPCWWPGRRSRWPTGCQPRWPGRA